MIFCRRRDDLDNCFVLWKSDLYKAYERAAFIMSDSDFVFVGRRLLFRLLIEKIINVCLFLIINFDYLNESRFFYVRNSMASSCGGSLWAELVLR